MGASFAVEFKKMSKRPAIWVLGLLFATILIFFGYFLIYVLIVSMRGGEASPAQADQFLVLLYPENFLSNLLGDFAGGGFGGATVLVLGALAVGSEYGWQTFKLVLIQKPGRLSFFSGKLLAIGAMLVIFMLVVFPGGALSSYAVATLQGGAVEWPPFSDVVLAFGAGWLMLATLATMGVFLAVTFRSTAFATGIGLFYLFVLEPAFVGLPIANSVHRAIATALPGKNASDLAGSFGASSFGQAAQSAAASHLETAEPTRAAVVLAVYALGFVLSAALIFRRRDVT